MTELETQSLIRLAVGKLPHARLFRNISSMVWVGRPISQRAGVVTLADAHQIHAGLFTGSSDLIGWTQRGLAVLNTDGTITPQKIAVFTSLEVKTKTGRVRPEQQLWLNTVTEAGGIAGVVRSPEEAIALLQ